MKNIKLVIADIDGTLVSDGKEMGPLTKKMLQALHDKGILLGLASGRPCGEHLATRASGWGFDFQFDVLIGMNGGQLWDVRNDKRYEYYPLKKEYIKEIIQFMDPTNINCYVYRGDTTLVRWYDKRMQASSVRNLEPMMLAKNDEEMWEKDNAKLLYRCKDLDEVALGIKVASQHPSPNYQYFQTGPLMIEFQDPRVNKGLALTNFCKVNNIDLAEVVAFGDAQNDDPMLKVAGMGVAMKNSGKSTLAVADIITEEDNNNDGVGKFIEKHLL